MNWYLVKLVFQVLSGEGIHTPQFDEQVRLIQADEVNWAYEKATVIGWLEQHSFLNSKEEKVEWKFIDVVEIHRIDDPEDGVLLCAMTEEPEDAQGYIQIIKEKAQKSLQISQRKESADLLACIK
jgi:hypothetical protein